MEKLNEVIKRKEKITQLAKFLLCALTNNVELCKDEEFLDEFVKAAEEALVARNIPYCNPTLEFKMDGELICPCFSIPSMRCKNCDIYNSDESHKVASTSCEAMYMDD